MSVDMATGRSETEGLPALLPLSRPAFRVFHVNDNTDDQVLFQAACQKGGIPFNWHVADSAEKGISYLRSLVEHSEKLPVCWPDLILLDPVMPMVSGFEVLKFIRNTAELKHLPVVVFNTFPGNRDDSLKFGANAFMLKPQDFAEAVTMAQQLYTFLQRLRNTSPPALQ
jgi:CheY-like chemotaxis protein